MKPSASDQVCVSHNCLYFYRYAMDSMLAAHRWGEGEQYASRFEDYTRPEPLPLCDFFIARARALAAFGRGQCNTAMLQELRRLRDEAKRMGLNSDLPALEKSARRRCGVKPLAECRVVAVDRLMALLRHRARGRGWLLSAPKRKLSRL